MLSEWLIIQGIIERNRGAEHVDFFDGRIKSRGHGHLRKARAQNGSSLPGNVVSQADSRLVPAMVRIEVLVYDRAETGPPFRMKWIVVAIVGPILHLDRHREVVVAHAEI